MNHRQKAIQLVRDFGELTSAELRRAWLARFGETAPKKVSFGRGRRQVVLADHCVVCAVTGNRVRPWVPLER